MSSISERASAAVQHPGVTDIPDRERPISEEFRLVARAWVEADKAANLLEECKTPTLSQMMLKCGDMPVSRAEMQCKASAEWREYLHKMVEARGEANLKRVHMKFIEMRYGEWQSNDANARREKHMGRQAT